MIAGLSCFVYPQVCGSVQGMLLLCLLCLNLLLW
jgi:hypothetical protein